MSKADRQKWDERYASGAYGQRPYPSSFLSERIQGPQSGRALDVACGAGRNAIYLASCGYSVDAIDISPIGLARAQHSAEDAGVAVNWICADLLGEDGPGAASVDDLLPVPHSDYDLIVIFRFVAPRLLERLPEYLAQGGHFIVEELLHTTAEVVGPSSQRFRMAPGALSQMLVPLQIVHNFEGEVVEPDGKVAALAQVVARA